MALFSLYSLLYLLPVALLFSPLHRLTRNLLAAHSLNLPIIMAPITWQSPLLPLLTPLLSPVCRLLSLLPWPLSLLGSWLSFAPLAWTFPDRGEAHKRLGPTIAIVSPFQLEIVIADHETARAVMVDWKTWEKPGPMYEFFNIFGKNVLTVNGADWQRHRKVGSVGFKEGNCAVVWREARRQVAGMVGWYGQGKGGGQEGSKGGVGVDIKTVAEGNNLLAMHVLMAAGFGKEYEFGPQGLDQKEDGCDMSYGEALVILLYDIVSTILFSAIKAPGWLLPEKLRKLKIARQVYGMHLERKIADEREAFRKEEKQGKSRLGDTLVASLIRANEMAKKEDGGKFVLTQEELYGNLFIYNSAGFETTASQLTYAIPLLAVYPDVQGWVREEVDLVLKEGGDYTDMYPKLVRTLSLMYETIRLTGPVQQLPRTNGPHAVDLRIAGRSVTIPPDALVSLNFAAIHRAESIWGKDAHEWKPRRWMKTSAVDSTAKQARAQESAIHTASRNGQTEVMDGSGPDGAFLGWMHGPRVCPGKKFSQVEFVAVIFSLLSQYTIEVGEKMYDGLPGTEGEHWDQEARTKLLGVINDSGFHLTPK
ncbi:Cytochrome P450-like protein 42 [Elsinoe fawcettii]|nr:Cytochrome P450-like protein 42 [Elsinoe fawcettii]